MGIGVAFGEAPKGFFEAITDTEEQALVARENAKAKAK